MDINQVLKKLSARKAFFLSERNFQNCLCNEIEKNGFKCEKSIFYLGQKVDILVKDSNQDVICVIQLRHKTATLSITLGNESFNLKNHGAQDQARYDYTKDIQSLEKIAVGSIKGYAILLTNDHRYWELPSKINTVDEDFLIYERRVLTGNLEWSSQASKGTKSNRDDNLVLSHEYHCRWETYSNLNAKKNNLFRYLLLEVTA